MVDQGYLQVIIQQVNDYKIPRIDYGSLKMEKKIGEGGQAKVYKAEYNGKKVAIKIITEVDIKCIVHEIAILAKLEHPCLPKFYGVILENKFIGYVSEFISGKTMDEWKMEDLSEDLKIKIMRSIADTLAYVHSNNCVHRDLKPENVMLDNNNNVYLIDFGIAKVLGKIELVTRAKGTVNYLAPEILDAEEVNEDDQILSAVNTGVDVWAFGCMISFLFSGYIPWTPKYKDKPEIIQKKLAQKTEFPIPSNVTNQKVLKILKLALTIDPKNRLSMEKLNEEIKSV